MNSQTIYSQIKERVSTKEAAEYYGYKVNRHGMMCCPFHQDKNPSMKVDDSFICFGCGEKGDVIKFTSLLFNLNAYDAALKLISDFRLNISVSKKNNDTPKTIDASWLRQKRVRAALQNLDQSVDHAYDVYCHYFRIINKCIQETGPISADDELIKPMLMLLQIRDKVEEILDTLLYGSVEDKATIIIKLGKEVNRLERRIEEFEAKY